LILRFGYRYGTGDQVELLPYTLFLHNPSLYPHDFFIHGLHATVPNERTVMAYLLLPFVNHLEFFCFLFQFISTIVLVMGLERLAGKFISNKYLVWLSVLVSLIALNDYALGNVEVYSECLQASGVAAAIIVWGLNLFLEERFIAASALISMASFIQLLEGLDVMLVLSAVLFIDAVLKKTSWKTFALFTGIFACTAGLYLVYIFAGKTGANAPDCQPLTNAELFGVLFEFRHPHHFILARFPKFKMIVFLGLTVGSLFFYARRSTVIFRFFLISIAGLFIYAFCIDVLHFILIANFQFYKVTQWMKFLGVVAVFGFLENLVTGKMNIPKFSFDKIGLGVVALLSWVIIISFSGHLPYHVPYELFGLKGKEDMIAICEQIKTSTPADAVFIQPFDNNELKFYAQRSSFVEFKANVRHKCFVGEWYRRVHQVFGISADDAAKGFSLQQKADDYYYSLNVNQLNELKQEGVTHMLVKKDFVPKEGILILRNNSYAVYKL
jgi:hypothetical protein